MNERYIQDFIRAGAIAKEVRAYGKALIQPGASYLHVTRAICEKIRALGAIPAFPPQMALNEVAAHFLPMPPEDIRFENQLVKLDIGVCYQGAIGDCAVSVDLSGKYQALIEAAEEALLNAERSVKVGQPIREIGKIIEQTITGRGFQPVRNLSGHGLGPYKIHTAPSIPNYDDGSTRRITAGMTFAIEPFATTGRGMIEEKGVATIFSLVSMRRVHSPESRDLLVEIKKFQGLPFAMHDLCLEGVSIETVKKALAELLNAHILHGYPPLVEETRGWVAQAENSILVDRQGNVHVTTR